MRTPVVFLVLAATGLAADVDWWKTALVYQIYPRSFKDSNGDGIGDLNGIREKLEYLKDLGVDAIWMSPINLSPMYDFGYDITDYRQIAPEYGTMQDFDDLLAVSNAMGIRVLLDFVPNHTSNESDWFVRSTRREPGYEDYYIWADGIPDPEDPDKILPPSNWVSTFRKSAWEYNEERGQFYLHQFVIGQPDLNYRSEAVQEEMKNVLRFWLDKGVSGFRVDAINRLYEADPSEYGGRYPDEPLSGNPDTGPDDWEHYDHIYTSDLDETYNVVYDWRDVLNEYVSKSGEYKLMMTEAYADLTTVIRYYGTKTRDGSVPFNFNFLEGIKRDSTAWDIKTVIDKWLTYMPNGKIANWVNGNHDQSRMATRQGHDRVDAMNMLALLLPGIAITYQGEEIGMTDGQVSWEETVDPAACNTDDPLHYWKKSRDPERTPFHWDDSDNAGFSSTEGDTWLPVADNYHCLNVKNQLSAPKSHLKFYKDVAAVRKSRAVKHGDVDTRALSRDIIVLTRLLPGAPGIVGIVNLSSTTQTVDLSTLHLLPSKVRVVASGVDCIIQKGTTLVKTNLPISGHCAVVFETVEKCC